MNLIPMNQNPAIVPTVDIDLFCLAHPLTAHNELSPLVHNHVSFLIGYNGIVSERELATSLDDTVTAWEAAYSEDYLNPYPGLVSQNFPTPPPREPNTLDKTPPPGLTQAQLYLCNFNIRY